MNSTPGSVILRQCFDGVGNGMEEVVIHLFVHGTFSFSILFLPVHSIVTISTILLFHFSPYNEIIRKKEVAAIFDYQPLWETMQKKGITQYQLLKNGIDNKTLDSLKKNKNITMLTLEKICRILDCSANDVIRFL